MSETTIVAATGADDAVKDISASIAAAPRPARRIPSAPEFPSTTTDNRSDDASVSVGERIDEADATTRVARWIPLVIPLLAAVMACDTYFIGWAVMAHGFAHS